MKYFKHDNGAYMEVENNLAAAMERFGYKEITKKEYTDRTKEKDKK